MLLSALLLCSPVFAQDDAGANAMLAAGLESYNNKDYSSAAILLRKAVNSVDFGADVYYMLIMSEMYSEDYTSAISDCSTFISQYPDSKLCPTVEYQHGKALHYIGDNDQSVMVLSDFCHENPDSPVYPSALYWIAECFYDDYDFDTARDLYQQIADDYADDSKADDARFKLDAIAQREREEKLLDLLKSSDDEYLAAKENYEKQLKDHEAEGIVALKKQLNEANEKIAALEAADAANKELLQKKAENEAALRAAQSANIANPSDNDILLANPVSAEPAEVPAVIETSAGSAATAVSPAESSVAVRRRTGVSDKELIELKLRAAQLQRILDERYSTSTNNKEE